MEEDVVIKLMVEEARLEEEEDVEEVPIKEITRTSMNTSATNVVNTEQTQFGRSKRISEVIQHGSDGYTKLFEEIRCKKQMQQVMLRLGNEHEDILTIRATASTNRSWVQRSLCLEARLGELLTPFATSISPAPIFDA
ncbi:hypothetical protein E3N88_23612 [Mikania micrantha]|uniref:Uncharacterized protein n=1 Tax=Mikania micrantha TaxID=192012 RepID=A0A5N6NDR8_9ASTR|nr:hypothetical protein E3N88_23612 [Mikania micrantha]